MGGTAVSPEPQLFWKILQAPPLKMNRQIFGPELDDERRDELDTFEELETPAEPDDPGGPAGPPLEPPSVVPDDFEDFDDDGDFDELGERELDGGGIVIDIEDMALPS